MNLIWTILIGLIVGLIARLLIPGKEGISEGALGWLITALIGIAGAFLGTFIGGALWGGEGYTAGWIMSIIGAVILLLIYRLIVSKTAA
ncbi:GlsB/YeaQ/YmgE family stress response membrane protein [soil metagenome]